MLKLILILIYAVLSKMPTEINSIEIYLFEKFILKCMRANFQYAQIVSLFILCNETKNVYLERYDTETNSIIMKHHET